MTTPDREALRAFYDRLGARQDAQAWYEDPATERLVAHARLDEARAVFELGCGTGRFAQRALERVVPATARWDAVDLSPGMVALARSRLAAFGRRVSVTATDGEPPFASPAGRYDRFVANYVFDLLPPAAIERMLAEAARLLEPGGLLCVTGLGPGKGPGSRLVAGLWRVVHRLAPLRVGGCRPVDLVSILDPACWALEYHGTVVARGIPSAVITARRRTDGARRVH